MNPVQKRGRVEPQERWRIPRTFMANAMASVGLVILILLILWASSDSDCTEEYNKSERCWEASRSSSP